MSERQLKNIIESYHEYCESKESPDSYLRWTAVAAVAAALERKCWLQWDKLIYPNQYILLVGPSGVQKSTALTPAADLLKRLDVVLSPSTLTKEALAKMLSSATQHVHLPRTGRHYIHSSATVISSELFSFTGSKNIELLGWLTDWYDCPSPWDKATRMHGNEAIDGVCLSILGASDPSWFVEILTKASLTGGFVARCIFVVETRKRKIVADPTEIVVDKDLQKALIHDLRRVNCLNGPFELSGDAKHLYVPWYSEYQQAWMDGDSMYTHPMMEGYMNRRATHLLKLAMTVSAARSDEMVISGADMGYAMDMLLAMEKQYRANIDMLGTDQFTHELRLVQKIFKANKVMTPGKIYNELQGQINPYSLGVVLDMLLAMGKLELTGQLGEQSQYRWRGEK